MADIEQAERLMEQFEAAIRNQHSRWISPISEELAVALTTKLGDVERGCNDPQAKAQFARAHAQVRGRLLSYWLPYGLWRKASMALIVIGSLFAAYAWSWPWMFAVFVAGIFSPRFVGEVMVMAGRLFSRGGR